MKVLKKLVLAKFSMKYLSFYMFYQFLLTIYLEFRRIAILFAIILKISSVAILISFVASPKSSFLTSDARLAFT